MDVEAVAGRQQLGMPHRASVRGSDDALVQTDADVRPAKPCCNCPYWRLQACVRSSKSLSVHMIVEPQLAASLSNLLLYWDQACSSRPAVHLQAIRQDCAHAGRHPRADDYQHFT